ncbi:MAG: type I 3-dehydroquinate dehydratase, partial [Bryobacterales bacterium]|nr:type I 3-dehydroquinate dehydratase [Bryobacteraceae bacterium]MDW8130655.1 type I 3-dehydroquinate dehydratase [Bryobacterales bacterium]
MPALRLPRIAVALGFETPEKLFEHACREVEQGETFLEFRLDYLADPQQGVALIRRFLDENRECVVLATCRRRQNHGRFNGSLEEQIRILERAVEAGARAVDVEIESAEAQPQALGGLRDRAMLVLSYHHFEGTPPLEPVLRRLTRVPADLYKIVTTARKPSDNYRVLALAKEHPRVPMVVLAMGQTGFPSRVLGPIFGSRYTYAAPSAAEGTAAGQVCAGQLRRLFR